jgi:hypothetical protein
MFAFENILPVAFAKPLEYKLPTFPLPVIVADPPDSIPPDTVPVAFTEPTVIRFPTVALPVTVNNPFVTKLPPTTLLDHWLIN